MLALPVPQFPLEKSQDKISGEPLALGRRKQRFTHPPLPPRPCNYRFPETPKPEKTPSRGPKPGFYGDHRGGRWGKGSRGTNGCPVPNSGEEMLPVGQRPEDFLCFFSANPCFFFPPGPPSRLVPAPRKKARMRMLPRGCTKTKGCSNHRNPNAPTFTPRIPLRHPQICPLSTFGGRNQRFWLPPPHPWWGAAGGEGNGRAAPGPHSHDLSGPARCYIEVDIFLFNPTAAKSTNRSVAASRPHFPPPRGAAHACAWLCAHVCHPSRRLTGARTTPFYFSF